MSDGAIHQVSAAIGKLQAQVETLATVQAAEVKRQDERHSVVTGKLEDIGTRLSTVEGQEDRLTKVEAVASDYTANKNRIAGAVALIGAACGVAGAWLKGILTA